MSSPAKHPPANVLGYAIGVGIVMMATVGSVLHFAFANTSTPLMLLGTFIGGAALGAAWAASRKPHLGDDA